MRAAILDSQNVVINIAKASAEFAESQGWIVNETARIGDVYDAETGVFTAPDPEPQPEPEYYTYKTDIWTRCTEGEAEILDDALKSAPAKQRRMWDDSLSVEHSSDYYTLLKQQMEDVFGAARTAEILAPSN